jgi:hypothetical protein
MSELTLKQKKALYYSNPTRCANCNTIMEYADRGKKYCNDICRGQDTKKYKDDMMRKQISVIEQSIREGKEIPNAVKASLIRTTNGSANAKPAASVPALSEVVPSKEAPVATVEETKPEPVTAEIVTPEQQTSSSLDSSIKECIREAIREGKVIYAPIQMNVFIVNDKQQMNQLIDRIQSK